MKQEVIIFDLDGTAIDSPVQKSPSKKLVAAIGRLRDKYYFCAATGRVWTFARGVLSDLQLVDPCIISAGAQICDPVTGKILWQRLIDEKPLIKVIEILKRYPEYRLLYNDGTENDYFNGGAFPKDFVAKEPVYFLEQVFIPNIIAEKIHLELNRIKDVSCVMVVSQKAGYKDLHIIDSLATKEHAVAELLRLIGAKKQNAIGIGDGHNDIHLFNAVGYKIAMGNAVPELKKMADKIIGPVENDGLADFLLSLKTS